MTPRTVIFRIHRRPVGNIMGYRKSAKQLAKFLAYVLGRRPDEFGLVPDEKGYVKIKDLLKAVCEEDGWRHVRRSHINEVLLTLPRPPVMVSNALIRAVDRGHLPPRKPVLQPPKRLFTCVRKRAYPHVLERGIYPPDGGRIIFSPTPEMALRIGKRSDADPVSLTVQVQLAMENGVVFYTAGEILLTAAFLPSGCFTGPPLPKEKPMPKKRVDQNTGETVKTPGSFHLKQWPETAGPGKSGRTHRKKEISWKKGRRHLKKISHR